MVNSRRPGSKKAIAVRAGDVLRFLERAMIAHWAVLDRNGTLYSHYAGNHCKVSHEPLQKGMAQGRLAKQSRF